MIYLDNASTSFPKPPHVLENIERYLTDFGVTPGRGSHSLTEQADEMVQETRELLASLLGVEKPSRVSFTLNATHAMNSVIHGFLRPGDHAIACSYCHNAAIRPLAHLEREGRITVDRLEISPEGKVSDEELEGLFRPETRLIVLNHVSNVTGVRAPLEKIRAACQKRNIAILLDVTQSIIYEPLSIDEWGIDFVVGTGHKSLLGPSGIGFLYVRRPRSLVPFMQGGASATFSLSPFPPPQAPDRFEAGTLNTTAIVGLLGGLQFLQEEGLDKVRAHTKLLQGAMSEGLQRISGLQLYQVGCKNHVAPIFSFRIKETLPVELAHTYAEEMGIALRAGIHCAPWIHESLGTLPTGTLRVSLGPLNCMQEIDHFLQSTELICKGGRCGEACA